MANIPSGPEYSSETFDQVEAEELIAIRKRREFVWASREGGTGAHDRVEAASKDLDESLARTLEGKPDADARQTAVRVEALDRHLVGLSFSGGGIRSGTFSVGILQGLSGLGLLRRFDYLSTVSGGGYAGAWLAAWIKRDGDPANVERQLDPRRIIQSEADRGSVEAPDPLVYRGEVLDEEPEPIFHLRQYSSYMTPRSGPLTADTWTIIGIWLRNGLINQLMLFPLTMLAVLAVRALVLLYKVLTPSGVPTTDFQRRLAWPIAAVGLVAFAWAFLSNVIAVSDLRLRGIARQGRNRSDRERILRKWPLGRKTAYYSIFCPLILAAACVTVAYRIVLPDLYDPLFRLIGREDRPAKSATFFDSASFLGLPNILGHVLAFGGFMTLVSLLGLILTGRLRPKSIGASFVAGGTGGLSFVFAEEWLASGLFTPDGLATFAPSMVPLVIVLGVVVLIAMLGREIEESEREWWSRLVGLLLIASIVWPIAVGTIVYLPALLLRAPATVKGLVATGWVGATLSGVLAGRTSVAKKGAKGFALATVAALAPPVFLAGLLGAVGLATAGLVDLFPSDRTLAPDGARWYWNRLESPDWVPIGSLGAACVLMASLGFYLIDVNLFSINAMYANRLARAYLGASRFQSRWADRWGQVREPTEGGGAPIRSVGPACADDADKLVDDERNENPVTGFDLGDDLALMDLKIGGGDPRTAYWGPQLIINTSLNLVGGDELAWRDRKAESFVLTPEYCGSKGTGYARLAVEDGLKGRRKAAKLAELRQLTLGRAISISGAAVDPNMSFYQSAGLTALLTVFNARLGYWIENPDRREWKSKPSWSARSPRFGGLIKNELAGRTDGKGKFVHLSDGGHFENLGVYELIRRRVRYIVCVDSGEDTTESDDNLANLIRLVRIDFGVRIHLETKPMKLGDDGLANSHVVIGRVRYDDLDNRQLPGVILYIKISMTGDEPSDVRNYAATHRDFPHQATDLRQSFDEAQFESYRALGDHVARVVFEDALGALNSMGQALWSRPDVEEEFKRGNQQLFAALANRWADQGPRKIDHESAPARAWIEVQRELRRDPALAALGREIYPETLFAHEALPDSIDPEVRRRSELHAVAEMLQIMEDAWSRLGMKGNQSRPLNRGWMNVFSRWSATRAFHRYWPILAPEFAPEFAQFCLQKLHLGSADPVAERLHGLDLATLKPRPDPRALLEANPGDRAASETAALLLLDAEFAREWPLEATAGRGILDLVEGSEGLRAGFEPAQERPLVWLGWLGPLDQRDAAERFAVGVFLVRRDPVEPEVIRLFCWIRPVHRTIGLGARFVETVLGELSPVLPGRTLRIRYPSWPPGAGPDGFAASWRAFFALFDFRNPPTGPTNLTPGKDLILERTLDGPG